MRLTLPGLFAIAFVPIVAAQDGSRLDVPVAGEFRVVNPSVRPPCAFWTTVEQIARKTRVLVGFENTSGCWPGPSSLHPGDGALDLTGLTVRQALDRLVMLDSNYLWRDFDGVIVMRPTAAWDDPTNVLNHHVQPFNIESAHVHRALHALLHAATPSLFVPHTDVKLSSNGRRDNPWAPALIDAPVSVMFPGGTLVEALNVIVKAHQSAIWQVGYLPTEVIIDIRTLEFSGGATSIIAARPASRQPSR